MATNEVPGANPANGDVLQAKCWAEAKDGSLIYVDSTENGRIIYSVFDMAKARVIEYRDAMDEATFKERFTKGAWTWHDKKPFPWDAMMKKGAEDGGRLASADDVLAHADEIRASRRRMQSMSDRTTAEEVADEEGLTGHEVLEDDLRRRSRGVGGTQLRSKAFATELASLLERFFGNAGV